MIRNRAYSMLASLAGVLTIGGKYVDYSYPMTFDSPYLKSKYKSGKIQIQYGGDKLNMDFSEKP